MTDKPTKTKLPKIGSTGYIVGFDGETIDGKKPRGKLVLPDGGMGAIARVHETPESAAIELSGRRAYSDMGKSYVLKVYKVKVLWVPFMGGGRGYKRIDA